MHPAQISSHAFEDLVILLLSQMEEALVFQRQAECVFTILQIDIRRQLQPVAVNLDRISPGIIVECLHASGLMKDKAFLEVFQASHLGSSSLADSGDRYVQLAFLILICVLLGSQRDKALVSGIVLIYSEIMPVAGMIVCICSMPLRDRLYLRIQLREVHITNILDRVRIAVYELMTAQLDKAINVWVNAVTEAYPDLKANENYKALQVELEGSENRIAVARKDYNDAAKSYNSSVRRFPKNIIAGMFGFEKVEYFEAQAGSESVPQVSFD